MTTILVENFRFKTIIGILDFERKKRQKIAVSAEFRAGEFVDYAEICENFRAKFDEMKFYKVEDALAFFAEFFKEKYPSLVYFSMKILKVKIVKKAVVGAKIEQHY